MAVTTAIGGDNGGDSTRTAVTTAVAYSDCVFELLAAALALGIAGFDPLGSVVLVAALGLGARRAGVIALGGVSVGTSLLLALAGTFGLTELARRMGIHPPHIPHPVWLVAVAAVGLALVIWGIVYLRQRSTPPGSGDDGVDGDGGEPEQATDQRAGGRARPRSSSARALALSGLLVGLSSLADPAFWAMVVHAARWTRRSWTITEALIWVVCSHSLLITLVVVYLAVGATRVEHLVGEVTGSHATAVRRIVGIAAAGFGVVLMIDVAVAMTTGSWWFSL